jgi:hypothetical protein
MFCWGMEPSPSGALAEWVYLSKIFFGSNKVLVLMNLISVYGNSKILRKFWAKVFVFA